MVGIVELRGGVQAGWATERAEAASAAAGGDGEVPTAGVNDGGVDSDDGAPGDDDDMML